MGAALMEAHHNVSSLSAVTRRTWMGMRADRLRAGRRGGRLWCWSGTGVHWNSATRFQRSGACLWCAG